VGTELVSLECGGVIAVNRIVVIVDPDSAPIKRLVQRAKEEGVAVDMTYGRKVEAVIVMESGHLVLVPVGPEEVWVAVEEERARRGRGRLDITNS
jgi:hypothetical protein